MGVIGARIAANWIEPGWLKEFCEALLPASFTFAVFGGRLTRRRVVAVAVGVAVASTIVEVARVWGWMAATPLVVLTLLLIYQAARAGILGPTRPVDAPPVQSTESSR